MPILLLKILELLNNLSIVYTDGDSHTVTFSCGSVSYSTQGNKVLGKTEQNSQDKYAFAELNEDLALYPVEFSNGSKDGTWLLRATVYAKMLKHLLTIFK